MSISQILLANQKIKNNLSSLQILKILNVLINAAAEPLFTNSHLMRQLILQALLQTQVDHRRKISIHSKTIAATCIIYGVSQNNYSAIKLCELDRNILLKAILHLKPYLDQALLLEQKLSKKPSTKRQLKLKRISQITGIPTHLLTPLARWIEPYLNMYLDFKERIMAKYHKYAYQESNRAKSYTKLFVDSEELYKNYLLALDKAIDKFDANRGTLTHYIKQWMLSARSAPEFDHQYGVAYSLPSNIRKDMERGGVALTNMSSSIDAKHLEIEDYQMSDHMSELIGTDNLLLRCLREIPNSNIPYTILDIPVILNSNELTKFGLGSILRVK